MPPPTPTRIALVGASGYGARHLDALAPLREAGTVDLVALVDPAELSDQARETGARHFLSLTELAEDGPDVDVAILATPLHTHAPLATEALQAGWDVLLEKPPTSSMATFTALCQVAEESGQLAQVGFQSLGSHAVAGIADLLASGRIGELRAVSATGLWRRHRSYFSRSPWAGLRQLGGVDVVDGVLTNPLAHAVVTALTLAGAREADDLDHVEVELYRANPIHSDDTSVLRAVTRDGIPVTCAVTLCAPVELDPWVSVEGTEGRATLFYKRDELVVETVDGTETVQFGRDTLLEDLLAVRSGQREALMVPLPATGAFMRVLEAVRTAPDPTPIAPEWVRWVDEGDGDPHAVVPDIQAIFGRVTKAQSGLAALDVPWAVRPDGQEHEAETLHVDGSQVAAVRLGGGVAPTTSPRPSLHPVRTLAGTLVTAHQPLDHVWHLGVGVALQDVGGVNVWGGRTYTREQGRYVWRTDHGRVDRTAVRQEVEADGGRLEETLSWTGPTGEQVLHEERTWSWGGVDLDEGRGWMLELDVTLSAPAGQTVALGSPGSNGREGGGYGGIFWRLPEVADLQVRTATAQGEQGVHGTVAPWLLVTGDFPCGATDLVEHSADRETAPASLLLLADDDDPWFVRVEGYPGVGRSLAWDRPVEASPGAPVRRRLRAVVVDGLLSTERAAAAAREHGR